MLPRSISVALVLAALLPKSCVAEKAGDERPNGQSTSAARGFELLVGRAYLPPDFDDEVFDRLWTVWPEPLKSRAREAGSVERRAMAFSRYGLVERAEAPGAGPALGYVSDGRGGWVMNCLACHAGKVSGRVVLGAPNTLFALATLTEEVQQVKARLGKPLGHMELGSLKIPLGSTRGTTNSVMFGVALGSLRDRDLEFRLPKGRPEYTHHDMDAPAFWNVRRKTMLYCDGFVPKGPRPLLQFVMLPRNSGATLRSWEGDYRDILAWIESLEPPAYPFPTNDALVRAGQMAFRRVCAGCHGRPEDPATYPNRIVPIAEVGTDPVRLQSLTPEYRRAMGEGWLGEYGALPYLADPGGYVAPPLDGIWASAPYLHNGSVPTLWHLLHPDERPIVWKRSEHGYDTRGVGLEIETFDRLPDHVVTNSERREYYDTRRPGKNAQGHRFPNQLNEAERRAVLEYLKTL
jgi:mono/diheme cytochrome c family protein